MEKRYLLYISQNYSFEILRPIQDVILGRGDQCAWFVEGDKVNLANFNDTETRLETIQEAIDYQPIAVFVPGNHVPGFIAGLKVQVFHGLEWKKKGHFRIRGFFDLYCTHGQITTDKFNQLAKQYGHFHVKETGWPKLDPLFQTKPYNLQTDLPVVLFAPTFSPNLTCALECFDEIKRQVLKGDFYWLVKFHPKMNPEWIDMYRTISSDNFEIVTIDSCLPLLKRADVLFSDTSSIISEFLLLGKPAVTFNNSEPGNYLIDIGQSSQIEAALKQAMTESDNLVRHIRDENARLHPYADGQSANRIMAEVDQLTNQPSGPLKPKPWNLLRNYKLRKKLGYWKW
jgi:CDP-glycerol glycerophosphotransferase (TagB/SpsB family)